MANRKQDSDKEKKTLPKTSASNIKTENSKKNANPQISNHLFE